MFPGKSVCRISKTDQALPYALGWASLISEERLTDPPRYAFQVLSWPCIFLYNQQPFEGQSGLIVGHCINKLEMLGDSSGSTVKETNPMRMRIRTHGGLIFQKIGGHFMV